jgi:hypothetical protein
MSETRPIIHWPRTVLTDGQNLFLLEYLKQIWSLFYVFINANNPATKIDAFHFHPTPQSSARVVHFTLNILGAQAVSFFSFEMSAVFL